MFVVLKPKNEREPMRVVIGRLMRATAGVPGIQVFPRPIQNINIGGRISKSEFQYTLQSGDTDALYKVAPELRDRLAHLPELRDVTTDLYITNPQMLVDIDREKAAVYGITVDQIRQELYQRLRLASGLDHLHAVERLPGHHGNASEIPGRPGLSVEAPDQDRDRPDHPDRVGRKACADGRAAAGQPSGPAERR